MSIVEIISLRGTKALTEEFCSTLMSRVRDQRKQASQPEIKTYRRKNIDSDVSFHLVWSSPEIKWEKSDFGVSLARYLKEYGLVSHSVWQELQPV